MFSDILLTVDFDRTLTALDGSIPERNIQAIRYFMENGGIFTVNTGRSFASFRPFLEIVPVNGPLLLLNGSAVWDKGRFCHVKNITRDVWPTLLRLRERYPQVDMELQAPDMHYLLAPSKAYADRYLHRDRPYRVLELNPQCVDFVKVGVYGSRDEQADAPLFDEIMAFLAGEFGSSLEIFRATPNIINVHARGVDKGRAAVTLQKQLGRKMLVCVGDEGNDVSMLQAADLGFCPADGAVAARFEQVCPCGEGAVADVIYEKIPRHLKNNA